MRRLPQLVLNSHDTVILGAGFAGVQVAPLWRGEEGSTAP
jgi:NADH dehydrogenase FAD-containing subunit